MCEFATCHKSFCWINLRLHSITIIVILCYLCIFSANCWTYCDKSKIFEKATAQSQTVLNKVNIYAAPEAVNSKNYTNKIDIYSTGKSFRDLYNLAEDQNDTEMHDIINLMMKENPNERPDAKEAYNNYE